MKFKQIRLAMFIVASISFIQAQSWIKIGNHDTEYAKYYLGISNPNVSRNDAINDALSMALEKAGIEKSSIDIHSVRRLNTQSQTTKRINRSGGSLFGESTSKSTGSIGRKSFASVSNVSLMDEYYNGEIGYILIRIPKPGYENFDFHSWNDRQNQRRKWGSLARSIVFPGWGQFKQQKKIRGTTMLLGFLGGGVFTGNSLTQYNQAIKNRNNSITADDKSRFYEESQSYQNLYYGGLILTGSFYLWNILDTQLFPGEWQDYYKKKSSRPITHSNVSNRFYRAIVVSSTPNVPIEAESNVGIANITKNLTGGWNKIAFNTRLGIGLAEEINMPLFFFSHYSINSKNVSLYETGLSLYFLNEKRSLFGFYPSLTGEAGIIIATQDWPGKQELLNTVDLGYGVTNHVLEEQYTGRIEGGAHRWFGATDLYFHIGYQLPVVFDTFKVNVFNGNTDSEGNKSSSTVNLSSFDLPFSSIKIGGVYFSIGLSYGLDKKFSYLTKKMD